MTISITTTHSSDISREELLRLLINLHKNGLSGLHISYDQNKNLVIHSNNRNLEFQLMSIIDRDKTEATKHFLNTYFSGIPCQITSVQRQAFLPRETTPLTTLIELAFKEPPSSAQNMNMVFALERIQNINTRQMMAISQISKSQSTNAGLYDEDTLLRLVQEDNDEVMRQSGKSRFGNARPFDHFSQESSDDDTPKPYTLRSSGVRESNEQLLRDIAQKEKQEVDTQRQHVIYEAQLVNLYQGISTGINATTIQNFPDCATQIMQIPHPEQGTVRTTENPNEVGLTICFAVTQRTQEKLIEFDIESIIKKLHERMGAARMSPIRKEFLRDVTGQMIGFRITYMGLLIRPQFISRVIHDVKITLFLTGTESNYRFNGFMTTTPQLQQVESHIEKPVSAASGPTLFSAPANHVGDASRVAAAASSAPAASIVSTTNQEEFAGLKGGFMKNGF